MWVHILIVLVFSMHIIWCAYEKIPYAEFQRPTVNYNDPAFMNNITFTARRYNRKNPLYYVSIATTLMKPMDSSYTLHMYVFPLMSFVHQRSILEVHSKWCDFVNEDNIFATIFKTTQLKELLICPLPAGIYRITNMTTSYGKYLAAFPFTQGRLVWNVTDGKNKQVLACHIDMEIKEMSARQFYKLIQ